MQIEQGLKFRIEEAIKMNPPSLKLRRTRKICFVGGPGVGKTILARDVANTLTLKGYKAELVVEYARDYIKRYGAPKYIWEQREIFNGQRAREKDVENMKIKPDFLVCDCATFLSFLYAIDIYPPGQRKRISKRMRVKYDMILNELRKDVYKEISSYDIIFFIPKEFEPRADGVRFNIKGDAPDKMSKQIQGFLDAELLDYYILTGKPGERTRKVLETILNSS